ncbi:MAG: PaaI family thioesterase [Polyangiaceae bacterium]|nr:PaaI family thioesterase [Polyangiaceae bacterium]
MTPEEKAAVLARFDQAFAQAVPHNAALGIRFADFDGAGVLIDLPYAAHLVGNPDTGVLHGGAVTALLDASCGAAVFARIAAPLPIATLDLRIDYLRPGEPKRDVRCRAECYKVTENVAFVRAVAFHPHAPEDLIASAAGTFILFRKGGKSAIVEPLAERPS